MTLEDFYIETKKLEDFVYKTSNMQLPDFNKCTRDLYKKGLIDKETTEVISKVWVYRNKYLSKGRKIESNRLPENIKTNLEALKKTLKYA